MVEVEKNCQTVDQEHEGRAKISSDELVALVDVIDILTSNDACDLFAKSVGTSFLQVSTQERDYRADKALQSMQKLKSAFVCVEKCVPRCGC